MRVASASIILTVSLVFACTALAVSPEKGRVVQGKYVASGNASVAGVKVQYGRSNVRITNTGRIKGRITKRVISGGQTISSSNLTLQGRVSSLIQKGRTFTAPARIRLGDGVVVRGQFQGLVDRSQRLTRYFRGKFGGDSKSNFVVRAR